MSDQHDASPLTDRSQRRLVALLRPDPTDEEIDAFLETVNEGMPDDADTVS